VDQKRSYYRILGVPREESAANIRSAYHRLAQQYHPDRAGPEGKLAFQEVNEAYNTLCDPEKRAEYDAKLSRRSQRQGPRRSRRSPPPRSSSPPYPSPPPRAAAERSVPSGPWPRRDSRWPRDPWLGDPWRGARVSGASASGAPWPREPEPLRPEPLRPEPLRPDTLRGWPGRAEPIGPSSRRSRPRGRRPAWPGRGVEPLIPDDSAPPPSRSSSAARSASNASTRARVDPGPGRGGLRGWGPAERGLSLEVALDRAAAARGGELVIRLPLQALCGTCRGSGRDPRPGSRCRRCGGGGAVERTVRVPVHVPPRVPDGALLGVPLPSTAGMPARGYGSDPRSPRLWVRVRVVDSR
jgi:curved DNA-binding protein CbpA